MEPKVSLYDLSTHSEYLFQRAEATFIHSLHLILPELVSWIDYLSTPEDQFMIPADIYKKMWDFRKIVNAYISVIVHCAPAHGIPPNIGNLSHYLGQIKDCLNNDVPVDHPETQHWVYELALIMRGTMLTQLEPQKSTENMETLQKLRLDIVNFCAQETLPAADFHLLRKRIRAFMHSYAVLLEDKFQSPDIENQPNLSDTATKQFKKTKNALKFLCDELGDLHDEVVAEALEEVKLDPQHSFEYYYDQKTVRTPQELKEQILALFPSDGADQLLINP
jgi:hypothetical protein